MKRLLYATCFFVYNVVGKLFFYHDSDILFRKFPDFSKMIQDDQNYLSDTIGYIGSRYIKIRCKKCKRGNDYLPENDLLNIFIFIQTVNNVI